MASAEAGSSRAAAATAAAASASVNGNAAAMCPDDLAALGTQLSDYVAASKSASIGDAYKHEKTGQIGKQRALEASMLEQAPTYLKLHDDIHASQGMLTELSSFLDVFYTDLSSLSTQMNALQNKSILLRQQLQNRRALEDKLRDIVSSIVLDPQYVDLIFADEATAKAAGLETWRACAERLSACLLACQELEVVLRDQLGGSGAGHASVDVKALKEAREIAEGCRSMAASKLRPLLISTFAPLRSSLSTNLPVLQSVLLRSYRPLYMFLSQHAPRVAIDVQRDYLAAARLYFETGFRRYERTLAKLRDKEKTKVGDGTAQIAFTDAASKSGLGFIGSLGGSTTATSSDPWTPDPAHLDNAKIADGPAVTLAYLAGEASYRPSLEALYRSLSLTFLDNASSEYCFLARFFEGIDLEDRASEHNGIGSVTTQSNQSSTVKVQRADAAPDDSEGPLPDDSASAQGGDTVAGEDERDLGTVVRLSEAEKRRLRSRGAIDELWKQIMDPSLNTYTVSHTCYFEFYLFRCPRLTQTSLLSWQNFVTSLLSLHPPLLSLYTMVKLNERMLEEVRVRGSTSVLESALISFKLNAWPVVQRQLNDAIESVRRLHGGKGSGRSAASGGTAGILGGLGGFFGGASASGATSGGSSLSTISDDSIRLICVRYGFLFSSVVKLNNASGNSTHEEEAASQDANVFASLERLRNEVETLLTASKARSPSTPAVCIVALRNTLETGPAPVSLPRVQAELSHWTEAERTIQGR